MQTGGMAFLEKLNLQTGKNSELILLKELFILFLKEAAIQIKKI
jgi:hypothetical protein